MQWSFGDHLNGYVVGDNGVMIKSDAFALNTVTGMLTGGNWMQKSIIDDLNITANANADINAIAFASRYNGVWGGTCNIVNNTQYPYVRLVNDESELFSTYFYYDKLGRIVVSQNTKQYNATVKRFSYTLYDELGRVVEAGEKTENSGGGSSSFADVFGTTVANYYNPKVIDDAKLNTWITDNSGARKEVTRSYYDESVIAGLPVDFTPNQETQRKRITHVTYEEVFDGDDATYEHATHYDYDIHGNVKTLLQDNRKMAAAVAVADQRFKRMDYNYDLISGNVHSVSYQNGEADAWHHAYEYDSDNRITNVYTSSADNTVTSLETVKNTGNIINDVMENHLWDHDAKYEYYSHGPLARVEIGDLQVQGVDYVYTLQGWIKGVNSNTLDANRDPGEDGLSPSGGGAVGGFNQFFARDVYGYSLNYFAGDYQSIDNSNHGVNSFTASIAGSDIENNRHDLFNGNIGSMVTTITDGTNPIDPNSIPTPPPFNRAVLPLGNAYKYDQLNRLFEARSYNNLDMVNNSFGTGGTEMYFNAFSYDANGNILTQVRNDDQNSTIDDMQYRYALDANGKRIQNRLYHVNDDTDYDNNDIDDMGLFDADLTDINLYNNYSYTEIGELERDNQEGIDLIIWRVDGKVKEVHRSAGSSRKNLKFDYDAMGNRIAKHVYETNNTTLVKSTYYLRDAQGNVMSVYEHIVDNAQQTVVYKQAEKHIYGSSRLGMQTKEVIIYIPPTNPPTPTVTEMAYGRELGLKQYELSNHLGNVLTVITDKKIPIESTVNSDEIDYYIVEILSASDYSPFGVTLSERDFTSEKYRYGFNGMEKDDEVKGKGNSYDFGARIYDNRLGRWLSVDSYEAYFPSFSSFSFAANCPTYIIDANGDIIFTSYEVKSKKEYKAVLKKIKSSGVMKINYELLDGNNHFPKQSKKGKGTGHFYLFLYPMDQNDKYYASAGGYFELTKDDKGNTKGFQKAKNSDDYMIGGHIKIRDYNYSTISEELFHAGQKIYYIDNNKTVSQLTMETEAKVAKVYAFYKSNATLSPSELNEEMQNNGFSPYEIDFLLDRTDPANVNFKSSVKNTFDDQQGMLDASNFKTELGKFADAVKNQYKDVIPSIVNETLGDLQYFNELKKEEKNESKSIKKSK